MNSDQVYRVVIHGYQFAFDKDGTIIVGIEANGYNRQIANLEEMEILSRDQGRYGKAVKKALEMYRKMKFDQELSEVLK